MHRAGAVVAFPTLLQLRARGATVRCCDGHGPRAGLLALSSARSGACRPLAKLSDLAVDGARSVVAEAGFTQHSTSHAAVERFTLDASVAELHTRTARRGARTPIAELGKSAVDGAIVQTAQPLLVKGRARGAAKRGVAVDRAVATSDALAAADGTIRPRTESSDDTIDRAAVRVAGIVFKEGWANTTSPQRGFQYAAGTTAHARATRGRAGRPSTETGKFAVNWARHERTCAKGDLRCAALAAMGSRSDDTAGTDLLGIATARGAGSPLGPLGKHAVSRAGVFVARFVRMQAGACVTTVGGMAQDLTLVHRNAGAARTRAVAEECELGNLAVHRARARVAIHCVSKRRALGAAVLGKSQNHARLSAQTEAATRRAR